MNSIVTNPLRLSLQALSGVTSCFQCIRNARRLVPQKYFHPRQELTSGMELGGRSQPTEAPMPPYPYGPNRVYPAADTGLYGGVKVQSGHKISKGRNKGKVLRRWYPNVRIEKVRSEALNQVFSLKITASCMRTIEKSGGIDQYLLGEKPARIKELGLLGWRLRWRVMNSPSMKAKYAQERLNLGLPAQNPANEVFEDVWNDEERKQELLAAQNQEWERLREKAKRYEEHWLGSDPRFKSMKSRTYFENKWTLPALQNRTPDSVQTPPLPSLRRS